jgi:anhydro-N-acetylmuramic acid kinase
LLFRDAEVDRAVVNIGGIANLTLLAAGQGPLRAFDCGPGNCLSDLVFLRGVPKGPGVDIDGARAVTGLANLDIVRAFSANEYFARTGPKSTDGPAMWSLFQIVVGSTKLTLEDKLATACYITADRIAAAVRTLADPFAGEIIISGGGTKNRTIMRYLREILPAATFRSTDEFGIPGDAKEAVAFALLGAATLDGIPGNIPAATGASRAVVLGAITPRP